MSSSHFSTSNPIKKPNDLKLWGFDADEAPFEAASFKDGRRNGAHLGHDIMKSGLEDEFPLKNGLSSGKCLHDW